MSESKHNSFPFTFPDFSKIRLGRGVVGKTSSLAAFGVVGFVFISVSLIFLGQPLLGTGIALCIPLCLALYIWKAFSYAEKNPGPALLEGADLISFSNLQLGAKDKSIIQIDATNTSNSEFTQIQNGEKE
jgi:hypothetical protein